MLTSNQKYILQIKEDIWFWNLILPTILMYGYPTNYDDKSKNKYFGTHSNILLVIVKICDLIWK